MPAPDGSIQIVSWFPIEILQQEQSNVYIANTSQISFPRSNSFSAFNQQRYYRPA
jgi:hypothetical protein